MSLTTFSGPVASKNGFITGPGVVDPATTASTLAVTSASAGRVIRLGRAAGIAVTLPAATGSQAVYTFFVSTAVTSNSTTIKVANATDVMNGTASVGGTTGAVFSTLPASDTITMNGTTTGGLIGSYVEVKDVAAGYWIVTAELVGSGTPVTPFSATV